MMMAEQMNTQRQTAVRVLLVEDDAVLADGLSRALRASDYDVEWLRNGDEADETLASPGHDLVILDLGLPGLDGFEVLRRLRERKSPVPVLVLTARDAVEDRVTGLDLGADDYLTKPFELPELEARVRALIRRGAQGRGTMVLGDLHYDSLGRRVLIDGQPLDLSARELGVMDTLLNSAGKVVSKEQMVAQLCDWGEQIGINAIEVYVHRLRKKIEPYGIRIRTIRGLGYLLEKPDAS